MQFLSDRDVKQFGGGGDCLGLGPSFAWGLEQAFFGRQAAWRLGKLMIAGSVLVVGAVP